MRASASAGPRTWSAPAIAEQIRRFWEPRMRAEILAHLAGGRDGLDPFVAKALSTLRNMTPHR